MLLVIVCKWRVQMGFMRYLSFLVLTALSVGCVSTAEVDEKKRLTETWYSKTEDGWTLNKQIKYSYSSSGELTEKVDRSFRDSTWTNRLRDTFAYKEDSRLLESKRELWKDDEWSALFGSLYTYSGADSDIIIKRVDTTYDASVKRPSSIRIEYIYDDSGNNVGLVGTYNEDGEWINWSKTDNVYNAENKVIERYFPAYRDGEWKNNRRMILTYDSEGNHIQTLRENWKNDQWESGINYLMKVNEDGLRIEEIWQRKVDGNWTDYNKVIHEYE